MAIAGTYIVEADVTRRLTSELYEQIFDDDRDGTVDEGLVNDFIADAESVVEQSIQKTYGPGGLTTMRALGTGAPRSVIRLCLDVFEVRAMRRHPEFIRGGWQQREALVQEDLRRLRIRELELDNEGAAPEPAVNEGGGVRSGDPNYPCPIPPAFFRGTGAF
jgi:hypothetical protein